MWIQSNLKSSSSLILFVETRPVKNVSKVKNFFLFENVLLNYYIFKREYNTHWNQIAIVHLPIRAFGSHFLDFYSNFSKSSIFPPNVFSKLLTLNWAKKQVCFSFTCVENFSSKFFSFRMTTILFKIISFKIELDSPASSMLLNVNAIFCITQNVPF